MRKPIVGSAFDADFMNESGRVACYLAELRYYRPRGFSKLAKEGDKMLRQLENDEIVFDVSGWMNDCDSFLTEWAQRIERNNYVVFGPFEHTGSVGFYYAVDTALDDCDIKLDAGDSVPRGFSGQAAFVTDHGNVTIQTFSNGRMCRELLSVV